MVKRLRLLIVLLLVGVVVIASATASWWLETGGLAERLRVGIAARGLDLVVAAREVAYVPAAADAWLATDLTLTTADGTSLGRADTLTLSGSLEHPTALAFAGFETDAGWWPWLLAPVGGQEVTAGSGIPLSLAGTVATSAGQLPLRASISAAGVRQAAVGSGATVTTLRRDGPASADRWLRCQGTAVPADIHYAALAAAIPDLATVLSPSHLRARMIVSLDGPADPAAMGSWGWRVGGG
jgi:hypothetical protein